MVMTSREKSLTRFLRSRGMALLSLVAAVLMMIRAHVVGLGASSRVDYGLALPSPNLWFSPGSAFACFLSIVLVVLTSGMMIYVNRTYNVLRTLSVYFAGLFLIMMASMPSVSIRFSGTLLLTPVVLWGMSLIYKSYLKPERTRQIFMAFFLLSAGAMFQYGFVLYVPVFVVGLAEMRILRDWRAATAAVLGLVTPPWILWGFGLAHWHWPQLDFAWVAKLVQSPLFVPVVVTLAVGVFIGFFNLFKILAYNSHARANNAFLSAAWLGTLIFCLIDCGNLKFYLGMLCCTVSYQMGHFFRLFRKRRAYIFALILLIFYITYYFAGN